MEKKIPHDFLATVKLPKDITINEYQLTQKFPNLSSIKLQLVFEKVNNIINKINVAVYFVSFLVIAIGFSVIASATILQSKNKISQSLIFQMIGISKKNILFAQFIELLILYFSVIFFSLLFAGIGSYYIVESIFNIDWVLNIKTISYVILFIGIILLSLIIYIQNKLEIKNVYSLVRNE